MKDSQFKRHILWLVALVLLAVSCREDDPTPSVPNEHEYVNNWIQENMEYWYLWNTQLPASPDKTKSPDAFFESLLVSHDKFSWIQDNYQELLNSLKGINKEAGYEFVLYRESSASNNVVAQIMYIKPGSPAESAGLLRGDVISHINDKQITTTNYQELLGEIGATHTLRYRSIDPDAETFSTEKTITLTTLEYSENPNFLHKVITVDDRKIGYYVYNFFAGGATSGSTTYDDQMDAVFGDFKSQGITDLVLDLRFNSGGAETSARNLASQIGFNVSDQKVFARREYNDNVEELILNDPDYGAAFLTTKFSNKSNNIGSQLTGGRVYVLTSSRTASASELVINALKPFMEVFLIGDVTYGKNVGSVSIYDENDPKNTWGMQPIVVKVYNSLDQSNYANGFTPDVTHPDNGLFIYPLGDTREALLANAIAQITGTATTGRTITKGEPKDLVGHSLDVRRRSFNLVISDLPQR